MWEPVLGTMHHSDTTKRYTYSLELNAEGEIIGGQWVILMDNGEPLTLHDAWAWVSTVDANGDGLPDHSVTEARSIIWEHYDFPDYAWSQTAVGFSDTFKPAASGYSFIANSLSTRTDLYHYFARLRELYLASTSVGEVEDRAESTGVEPADSGFEADSEQPGQ